jgi:hypothetical protein
MWTKIMPQLLCDVSPAGLSHERVRPHMTAWGRPVELAAVAPGRRQHTRPFPTAPS